MGENAVNVSISWDQDNGKVQITGPMVKVGANYAFDELATFWMLDRAKDMIKLHNKKVNLANMPRIQTPGGNGAI